ncbi:hypothetical protein SAMN04488490_1445 [Marinobacter sp. LV10R510-11A]|uniref:hypothetical protein n=1 Tax=Marinobacter sp. LV10R510-11A TaxID=1415568 RepID=UPI000BB94A05|nr:hypothetical protein [Marinobacter sp. LV10R510-11A]SOB75805.1 hypothetical protein SAMN04488490_1445 [Marinobacter sp. LV10R510-11A]
MFEKFRRNSAAARLLEEQLYEQVVMELSQGQRRDGLWAKAMANSDGSEEKAKSLYIKYRVQSIKDESEIAEAVTEQEEYNRKNVPAIERQKRVNNAEALLRSKGYWLLSRGNGWVVKKPLGGQQPINTLDQLEQYAKSR